MGISFRLSEAAQAQAPSARGFGSPGGGGIIGGGLTPLNQWNILTGDGLDLLVFDVSGRGWTNGSWGGEFSWLRAPLRDSGLTKGYSTLTFVRPGTSSRVNKDGDTESLAANEAAYDWIEGPAGTGRYCYRTESTGILTAISSRNIRRRVGAISCWVRPNWNPAVGSDCVLFESAGWKLWQPSGQALLKWEFSQVGGAAVTAASDISSWAAEEWHLVLVDWSVPEGASRMYLDGVLTDTESFTARPEELDTTFGIGQSVSGGNYFNGYLADFAVWPFAATATLASNLFLFKA